MILQQLGWSYGHLRQMQSMQKAVQLATFCVSPLRKCIIMHFARDNSHRKKILVWNRWVNFHKIVLLLFIYLFIYLLSQFGTINGVLL